MQATCVSACSPGAVPSIYSVGVMAAKAENSLSPSKKSTEASMRSSLSGPKLRCLSPSQKRAARLQILELQLKSRHLFSQERKIHWDLSRSVTQLSASRSQQQLLTDIQDSHLSRCHSARIDAEIKKIAKEKEIKDNNERFLVDKETKNTLKLRELDKKNDEIERYKAYSGFLRQVQSQKELDRRRDRDQAYHLFTEKVQVFQAAKRQEKTQELLEMEYRRSKKVQDAVEEEVRRCRELEKRLKTAQSVKIIS